MTDADIKKLRELCEKAITAPWMVLASDDKQHTVVDGNGFWVAQCGDAPNDAAFIAAARTAIPALLDEIERLRGENATSLANADADSHLLTDAIREIERLRLSDDDSAALRGLLRYLRGGVTARMDDALAVLDRLIKGGE